MILIYDNKNNLIHLHYCDKQEKVISLESIKRMAGLSNS